MSNASNGLAMSTTMLAIFTALAKGGSDKDGVLEIAIYNQGSGNIDLFCDGHHNNGDAGIPDRFAYIGDFGGTTSYTYGDVVKDTIDGGYFRAKKSIHWTSGFNAAPSINTNWERLDFMMLPSGASLTFAVSDAHDVVNQLQRILAIRNGSVDATLTYGVVKRR